MEAIEFPNLHVSASNSPQDVSFGTENRGFQNVGPMSGNVINFGQNEHSLADSMHVKPAVLIIRD